MLDISCGLIYPTLGSFRLSKGSFGIFFQNAITWILWIVIVGALAVPPLLAHFREKKRKAEGA